MKKRVGLKESGAISSVPGGRAAAFCPAARHLHAAFGGIYLNTALNKIFI